MDLPRIPLWAYVVFAVFVGWLAWSYAAFGLGFISATSLWLFDVHLSDNTWDGTFWVWAIVSGALLIWGVVTWRRQSS